MPALLYFYVEWLSLNARVIKYPINWNSTQWLKPMDISWENDNIKGKKKNLYSFIFGTH